MVLRKQAVMFAAFFLWALSTWANVTAPFVCSDGIVNDIPQQVTYLQAKCVAQTSLGNYLQGVTNGLFCKVDGSAATNPANVSVAAMTFPGTAEASCVEGDQQNANPQFGAGFVYLNCPLCIRQKVDGTLLPIDYVFIYANGGNANAGCTSGTFGGAATWKCLVNSSFQLWCMQTSAGVGRVFVPCSWSTRVEPDMGQVVTEMQTFENYAVMLGIGLTFVLAFAWGWKLGHGSNQQ